MFFILNFLPQARCFNNLIRMILTIINGGVRIMNNFLDKFSEYLV